MFDKDFTIILNISRLKLIDYIQGNRRGKEANRLERKAMNDLFLNDAIDGFDAINDNHFDAIQKLEKQLEIRIASKRKTKINRWRNISIAASIALLIGVGGFIFTKYQAPSNLIVDKTVKPHQSISIADNKFLQIKTTVPTHKSNVLRKPNLAAPKVETIKVDDNIISTNETIIVADVKTSSSSIIADIAETREANITSNKSVIEESKVNINKQSISGRVIDENGEPIIGANILIKGTNKGAITDINGKFELNIPIEKQDKAILVANFIGYNKKEIPVLAIRDEIKLEPSSLALNEVVVVGYGAQKKTTVVGSVSSVPSKTQPFGEKEFEQYFNKNRQTSLCDGAKGKIIASFYIDNAGKPTEIKIIKSPCEKAEDELIRLLNSSPRWTKKDRNEKLSIKL